LEGAAAADFPGTAALSCAGATCTQLTTGLTTDFTAGCARSLTAPRSSPGDKDDEERSRGTEVLTEQIRMQRSNGTTSTAISVAAGELEDVRTLNYDDMADRSSTTVVDGVTYSLETSVVANSPQKNMKTVHTTVVWTEPAGAKSYTLHSIYTDVTH
jgi:hypothetical protein